MRRKLNIGIGAGAVAVAITLGTGVASAMSSGHTQAARPAVAVQTVSKHITKAQARRIALALVPHSRVAEIEPDDLHNRPVWKVTLVTRHGRVIVDVDKRTGKAAIIRRSGSGGGHDDAARAAALSAGGQPVTATARTAGTAWADDHGRDARDHDAARDDRHDRGDRGGDGR